MTSAALFSLAPTQRPAGPVAIGHQGNRVLVHLDQPRDFLNYSGTEALAMAYQLVAAARAAGAAPAPQRTLF